MSVRIEKEGAVSYRVLKRPSPLPYLAAGAVFLLYGLTRPIVNISDYAWAAGLSCAAFWLGRRVWKGTEERIELPPDTGEPQADQLVAEAREALVAFRAANERIADPKLSACIEAIERTCLMILDRLVEQPALHGQLRTFLRYYLPTTRKLLDARASLEQGGKDSENAKLVRERTDRVLPEIERAFRKQMEALDKHRYLDLQVEMDVLEGMLKADGLSDMK